MYYKTPYTPTGPAPRPEAKEAPVEAKAPEAPITPPEAIDPPEAQPVPELPAPEAPAAAPALSAEEVAAMVAEAEQRGYLRGCNERIDTLMERPAMWQQPAPPAAPADDDTEIMILNHLRRSVWD